MGLASLASFLFLKKQNCFIRNFFNKLINFIVIHNFFNKLINFKVIHESLLEL